MGDHGNTAGDNRNTGGITLSMKIFPLYIDLIPLFSNVRTPKCTGCLRNIEKVVRGDNLQSLFFGPVVLTKQGNVLTGPVKMLTGRAIFKFFRG